MGEREITMTFLVTGLTREARAKYTAARGGTQPAWDCRLDPRIVRVDILVT